jgi:hypothetical protein
MGAAEAARVDALQRLAAGADARQRVVADLAGAHGPLQQAALEARCVMM